MQPVFPKHISPEVQYGNERADSDQLRTPKVLDDDSLPNSTVKPHITHKPEKPLAVLFKESNEISTETITRAETINEFANDGNKQTTKKVDDGLIKILGHKEHSNLKIKPLTVKQYLVTEPRTPLEIQELHNRQPAKVDFNFTSGHSKLFGISIEDAERMKSTTQSSVYNTRVSPTLPTWRDGDDSTTKKYPVNVNFEGKSQLFLGHAVQLQVNLELHVNTTTALNCTNVRVHVKYVSNTYLTLCIRIFMLIYNIYKLYARLLLSICYYIYILHARCNAGSCMQSANLGRGKNCVALYP